MTAPRATRTRFVLVAGVVVALTAALASVQPRRPVSLSLQQPQTDALIPGTFDHPDRPVASRSSVRYQVNATVLLPLLVTSIPIASRDDVGFGSATARDIGRGDGGWLRAYEFFAASIPERARGLNRLGFLRELVHVSTEGTQWTAHFGVVSSNRETSREEAEKQLDQDERLQPFSVLDGLTDRAGSSNHTVELDIEGRWPTANELYSDLHRALQAVEPDEEKDFLNDGAVYREPLGFLGGMQWSLRTAAGDVARGESPGRYRFPFVHNGDVSYLELTGYEVDAGRAQEYAERGLIEPQTSVHKLDYRILDSEGDTVQPFEVWTELPPGSGSPPGDAIIPIAFEFKARAFLELRAVRTEEPSPIAP